MERRIEASGSLGPARARNAAESNVASDAPWAMSATDAPRATSASNAHDATGTNVASRAATSIVATTASGALAQPPSAAGPRSPGDDGLRPIAALAGELAYRVPRAEGPIRLALDGNEGLEPPADLLAALARCAGDDVRRYPDARPLEAALAARYGVDASRVLVTAGADDALERALRAVLAPGRELVLPVPTFEMIERYARFTGADVRTVAWSSGHWPLEGVLAALTPRTTCIAFVSPNNPTGLEGTQDALRAVCAAAPRCLVVVDQAYAEFGDVDCASVALAAPNALLVRSFSKALGLAGVRAGYAIGSERVIGWLRALGQPYAVAGPSLVLARARLELWGADVRAFVDRVRAERVELARVLRALGLRPLESRANFVCVRCDDARRLWSALARRGIAVRAFGGREGLEDALRITCPGAREAFDDLVGALRSACDELRGAAGGSR